MTADNKNTFDVLIEIPKGSRNKYEYDFELKKIRFNGSFEVNNIMNKYYDIVLNYPMPGRQFKIIISTYL